MSRLFGFTSVSPWRSTDNKGGGGGGGVCVWRGGVHLIFTGGRFFSHFPQVPALRGQR